ncbi:hypothetical protein VTK56DRAFT_1093 [Thermocarpiscus australiensis]
MKDPREKSTMLLIFAAREGIVPLCQCINHPFPHGSKAALEILSRATLSVIRSRRSRPQGILMPGYDLVWTRPGEVSMLFRHHDIYIVYARSSHTLAILRDEA